MGSHSPRCYSGACETPAPPEGEHLSPDRNPSNHGQYESAQGWQIFEERCKAFSMSSFQSIIQLSFNVSNKCSLPSQHTIIPIDFLPLPFKRLFFYSLGVQIGGKNESFQNSVKYPGEPAPYMLNY